MKSKITSVRLKLADYFILEAKAKYLGVDISSYIRQAALNGHVIVKQVIAPGDIRGVYNGLNNLNQAQKLANTLAQKQDDQAVLAELNRVVAICEATREELKKFLQERK
ncbi:plasmid mobilization protein [Campylobacter showae]|uniref:plasmid mobilization protein n=1 Tax=Campylobacter showae TaxID=204 RepID=UPI000F0931EF|nr:hypothetical protein [Campylobacter showae]